MDLKNLLLLGACNYSKKILLIYFITNYAKYFSQMLF